MDGQRATVGRTLGRIATFRRYSYGNRIRGIGLDRLAGCSFIRLAQYSAAFQKTTLISEGHSLLAASLYGTVLLLSGATVISRACEPEANCIRLFGGGLLRAEGMNGS